MTVEVNANGRELNGWRKVVLVIATAVPLIAAIAIFSSVTLALSALCLVAAAGIAWLAGARA